MSGRGGGSSSGPPGVGVGAASNLSPTRPAAQGLARDARGERAGRAGRHRGRSHAGQADVERLRLGTMAGSGSSRRPHGVPAAAAPTALTRQDRTPRPSSPRRAPMPRVVVHVMPKPEILDPQGKAVAAALPRLGFEGIASVRQGKRFELEIEGEVTDEVLASLRDAATTLLSNPVIEDVVSIDVEGSADGKAQA